MTFSQCPNSPSKRAPECTRYSLHVFCILLVLLSGCAGGPKWAEIDITKTPTQDTYPDADAVFLLDEATFQIGEEFFFSRHVAVKILSPSGLKYADIKIPLAPRDDLDHIAGQTIRPDGSIVQLDPADCQEISSFPDFMLYQDSRAVVFAMPGVQVGSVIEYEYGIVYDSPFPPVWQFQRSEPVQLAKFTIEAPDRFDYRYLLTQTKNVHVARSVRDAPGETVAAFEAREVRPVVLEPHMPPFSEVVASLQFALCSVASYGTRRAIEGDSWKLLGQQYSLLSRNFLTDKKTSRAIMNSVEELTRGAETDAEKIESIYHFMQSEIRYVAVRMDESGILPQVPSDVFAKRYGDCKDQAFLFITMLKQAGIEAYPVLTRTRSAGHLAEDFVSFGQFNHMVVAVPAEHLTEVGGLEHAVIRYTDVSSRSRACFLLDTTSLSTPCWCVPRYLENTKALVIHQKGGTLVTVPTTSAYENRIVRQCDVEIREDGTIRCSMEITRFGQAACSFRSFLQEIGRSLSREWFHDYLSSRCPGASPKSHSVLGQSELSEPVILRCEFLVPQYVQRAEGFLIFRPSVLRELMSRDFVRETREHAVCFDYAQSIIDVVRFHIPEGYRAKTLSEPLAESVMFGDFSSQCFEEQGAVVLSKQIQIRETRIPAEHYDDVRSFFRSVLASETCNVTLESM